MLLDPTESIPGLGQSVRSRELFTLTIVGTLISGAARTQPETKAQAEARAQANLTREFQNPLPDLATLRFINDVDVGLGEADDSDVLVRINLLLPMRVMSMANLVVQTMVPLHSRPTEGPESEPVNGVGDALQHLLLGPTRAGHFIWALGPVLELPTATRRALGTGKVSLGPSVILSYQNPSWTLGLNAWQLWSVAGHEGGPDVERTHLQPAVSYTLPTRVALGVGSETVIDWLAPPNDRLTLPLLVTMSRVTQVSDENVNVTLGARYYLDAPSGGPEWGVRLAFAFTFEIDHDAK